ncbi:MAG: glutamate-5-semialdehyde dehydrogenase [Nanoarchaeota archaeon]
MNTKIINIGKKAKKSAGILSTADTEQKNKALYEIAKALDRNKSKLLLMNQRDVGKAKYKLSSTLLARLKLNEDKIYEIFKGVNIVLNLDEPVGMTLSAKELDNGLELYQVTCPIGVIGIIFESRPDAVVQIASLCIKSGNAVIMKGGSEARNSNKFLVEMIRECLSLVGLPTDSVQLIETRADVKEMLKLDKYIDVIVPRGSYQLVKFIKAHTRIPVIAHDEGICHVYIDKFADIDKAVNISYDAKCQYPAVCNAMETLLVHKDIAEKFLPLIAEKYEYSNVRLLGDAETRKILRNIGKATEKDWRKEYNDLILSIKIVVDVDSAIEHINNYGSKHTDAIVTEDDATAYRFINKVDSSSVMRNCSTRFSDGYRYGKGAELGISTSKLHPRGPVGLEGLVTYKYVLIGNGHIVADYTGENAKRFLHRELKKKFKVKFL